MLMVRTVQGWVKYLGIGLWQVRRCAEKREGTRIVGRRVHVCIRTPGCCCAVSRGT